MQGSDFSKIENLINLSSSISLSHFDRFIASFIQRKADKKKAIQELDHMIGSLQNHVLLLSVHVKQNYLIGKDSGISKSVPDELYTKQEVANRYRVSVRTIGNWIRDGLETEEISGILRIGQEAIDEFKRKKRTKKFHWKSISR